MQNRKTFTPERIEDLKRNIDFSDIPEISDEQWKMRHLRNYKPIKKQVCTLGTCQRIPRTEQ